MENEDLNVSILDEPVKNEPIEQEHESIEITNTIEKPKQKRVLTEKQKEALKAGRLKRLQNKKPEETIEPQNIQKNENLETEPKAQPKKTVICPDCNKEIAKSSLRNHRVRFHSKPIKQDDEPPAKIQDESIQIEPKIEISKKNDVFLKKTKRVLYF